MFMRRRQGFAQISEEITNRWHVSARFQIGASGVAFRGEECRNFTAFPADPEGRVVAPFEYGMDLLGASVKLAVDALFAARVPVSKTPDCHQ